MREQLKSEKWKVEPVRSDETEEAVEAGKIAVGDRVWLRDMETVGECTFIA